MRHTRRDFAFMNKSQEKKKIKTDPPNGRREGCVERNKNCAFTLQATSPHWLMQAGGALIDGKFCSAEIGY